MSKKSIFITVASWEERCWFGFEKLWADVSYDKAIVFYFEEYLYVSKQTIANIRSLCQSRQIECSILPLSFKDSLASWKTVNSILDAEIAETDSTFIDISTMPRETIWTIFDNIAERGIQIEYAYHTPKDYAPDDWISRDPGKPRIVYGLGGISRLQMPTRLIIATGYDVDRVKQMIFFFEPEKTILGIQVGDQFGNKLKNEEKFKDEFKDHCDIEFFNTDAYSIDHGQSEIEKKILENSSNSDIVMSSLGPKLSAIALFTLHKKYENTSLAYGPSYEYNLKYSSGLLNTILGKI